MFKKLPISDVSVTLVEVAVNPTTTIGDVVSSGLKYVDHGWARAILES
jgi:hypothetical protein